MILPTTSQAVLLVLILSVACWGSWANTKKLAAKWRFELWYYDYSFGLTLCALIAAFTFGSMDQRELTFQDNFLIAARRQMAWAFAAGVVFNLANTFLVAALSVAGMAVVFPIVFGLALVIGAGLNLAQGAPGSPALMLGGAFLLLVAVVVSAFAHSAYLNAAARQATLAGSLVGPRPKSRRPPPTGAAVGVILSVISGLLMPWFPPLLEMSRAGLSGVAPYGIGVLFAAGVFFSTLLYIPFFATFPVRGEPTGVAQYFRGSKGYHLLGILGGMIWMVGALCNFIAANAALTFPIDPIVGRGLAAGAPLLSALWGLLAWREFKGASLRVNLLLAGMLVLFLAGLAMISMAPPG
jgi:glucose uptake protein